MAFTHTDFKSALYFGSDRLTPWLARIAEQQQLLELLRSALPEGLSQHAVHCVLSGNKLIVYCRSAAWASQIRFFQSLILNKINGAGQRNIGSLQVRLLLDSAAPQATKTKRLPSRQVVEGLIEQSAGEADELAAALNRLGKTLLKRRQLSAVEQ